MNITNICTTKYKKNPTSTDERANDDGGHSVGIPCGFCSDNCEGKPPLLIKYLRYSNFTSHESEKSL